jgi:UDP-N-acetylglucosamine--N-acetylmuramyl-(pentapeptide) pyrophosphoryl-undecaprenol N-acetylglucosamine transferase
MNVLMTGGGTGGHIYPGLVVSQSLIKKGHQVFWGGRSFGMEKELAHDLPYLTFWALPLRSKNIFRQMVAIFALLGSVVLGLYYLKKYRIEKVLTWGGYVSVAPALAAYVLGVPVICFEQNTKMGMANRLIAKIATTHLSGLCCEDHRFKQVGNPIRSSILDCDIDPDAKALLLMGGSQGAEFLRKDLLIGILECFPELPVRCILGSGGMSADQKAWKEKYPNLTLIEYESDMSQLYAKTGLVISRAGASAVSEIVALGLRALFVPMPKSADNHQWHNAMSVKSEGVMVEQESVPDIISHIQQWQKGIWQQPRAMRTQAEKGIIEALMQA